MSKKDLPSYMVMFGACVCIILLVAARHHPPSRQKIKEIWHGRVYWLDDNTTLTPNLRSGLSVNETVKESKELRPETFQKIESQRLSIDNTTLTGKMRSVAPMDETVKEVKELRPETFQKIETQSLHAKKNKLDGITKEKLWRTGYKANVLLHCHKDGEKFDKTIRDLVPTTDKLFVIGNGPSSQNIETYLDDYDKVVRFNMAPLGVHGVGTRTDIHVVNIKNTTFHGPLVIFMECAYRRRDISARTKPGQTFCRVDKMDELCKRDPSRGFLFLSIARTASTVVSGFDQLRNDGVNHYYEKTTKMWHGMNAEHDIITKGKWPVIIADETFKEVKAAAKRKMLMMITTHDRKGYLETLSQWLKLDPAYIAGKFDLIVNDDASTQYGEYELRKWFPNASINIRQKRLKAGLQNRLSVQRFVDSNYDIMINLDSDSILDPSWYDFIMENMPESGFATLYHSSASWHKTLHCKDGVWCHKSSTGALAMVFLKKMARKMLKEHKRSNEAFDWGVIDWLKRENIPIRAPKKSLVLHYGYYGQNNSPKHMHELADGFNMKSIDISVRPCIDWWMKANNPNDFCPLEVDRDSPEVDDTLNSKSAKLTCAFVANNPKFPKNVADEIDSHDIVMRYNNYWAKNFWPNAKKIWGQKVTHVIMNDMGIGEIDPEVKTTTCWIRREDWLDVSMFNPKIHLPLSDVKRNMKEFGCKRITKEMFDKASSWIRKYEKNKNWSRQNSPISPTTGFFGVFLLEKECAKMDFYGFSGDPGTWANHRYDTEHDIIQNRLEETSKTNTKPRHIYIDLGANWCNTLDLYKDLDLNMDDEAWEIYAFEASPFLQRYVNDYTDYKNGIREEPIINVPRSGSSYDLASYGPKYGCRGSISSVKDCIYSKIGPELKKLKPDPFFDNNTELINSRKSLAAKTPIKTRYVHIPAAAGNRDGSFQVWGDEKSQLIGGVTSVNVGKWRAYTVPVVDVVTWMRTYFSKDDFIVLKMDIEGAEFPILNEMLNNNDIQNINYLIMECHTKGGNCNTLRKRLQRVKGLVIMEEGKDYKLHSYKNFDKK